MQIGDMGEDASGQGGTFTILFGTTSEFVAAFAVLSCLVMAASVLSACVAETGLAQVNWVLWHFLSILPAGLAWRLSLALRGRANETYRPQGAAAGFVILAMLFASGSIADEVQDALGCRNAATIEFVRGG